jgi:chromosome segregation ATPase
MTTPVEPTEDATAPKGSSKFYSEEEFNAALEAARKQEKDKLYPQISKQDERYTAMNDELKELRRFQKAAEKQEADRLAQIDAARKQAEEAEMSAKDFAEKVRRENEERIESLRQETEAREALYKRELEFMQLQNHVQRRIGEEQDSIAPELLDYITGNSVEEIEASIEKAKIKTAAILEGLRQATQARRSAMPGVAPAAGTNGVGPMDQQGDRQLTKEDIEAMDMNDFGALRKKLGIDRLQANNTGVFGMQR